MTNQFEKISEFQQTIATAGISPKLFYTKAEVSKITGLSISTLDRLRAAGIGPGYKKLTRGKEKNGRIVYPVKALADFYFDTIKTA